MAFHILEEKEKRKKVVGKMKEKSRIMKILREGNENLAGV